MDLERVKMEMGRPVVPGQWIPPEWPDKFGLITDDWLVYVYFRAVVHHRTPGSVPLGENLPNLPYLAKPLMNLLGLLDAKGIPTEVGKYFIHNSQNNIFYHREHVTQVFNAFIECNPDLDYRGIGRFTPEMQRLNVTPVLDLIQKILATHGVHAVPGGTPRSISSSLFSR
jgi:hypothetical protein